jgi:hypothetical protein
VLSLLLNDVADQSAVHAAQKAWLKLPSAQGFQCVEVVLEGSDIVDRLTLGCMAEVTLRCSPGMLGKHLHLPCKYKLQVLNAIHVPIAILRAQQIGCPIQARSTVRLTGQVSLLHDLMDSLRLATGFFPISSGLSISWYMLISTLLSAVAIGEEQRESKATGQKAHRCQVCLPMV